mmetsp:Transcript_80939/g.142782  ORF Transcript_80939/g.142782 Transcript_80939/m.142782 type:complete len:178 (+) Transcript_80939:67-600(+)
MAKSNAIGNGLALAGLATSLFSLVIGLIYIKVHFPSFELKYSTCWFEDPDEYSSWVDCNGQWASNWGMVGLPYWVPLIVGAIGTVMYRPLLLEVCGFPKNFLQFGIFQIFQGMFGNMGFCGKLGVVCGFASVSLGIVMIVASLPAFGIKSDRMEAFSDDAMKGSGLTDEEDEEDDDE